MDCLIVEGGGFRTGFTAGVLDAMLVNKYNPFNSYYGISGGSISLSYFISDQYKSCFSALQFLADHPTFTDYKRAFQPKGYMDIDYIKEISNNDFPFLVEDGLKNFSNKSLKIVVTNKDTGKPEYLTPQKEDWIDLVVASCSLPFVTKGEHMHDKNKYFDGGWGDALPVIEAYNKGAREILVVRTWISGMKSTQSWADYFGSIYYRSNPILSETFNSSFKKYNEAIEFIENPPDDLKITEIAPENLLYSGTYMYSNNSILRDYRYGLDLGTQFLSEV